MSRATHIKSCTQEQLQVLETASVYSGIESLSDAMQVEAIKRHAAIKVLAVCERNQYARKLLKEFYNDAELADDARQLAKGKG